MLLLGSLCVAPLTFGGSPEFKKNPLEKKIQLARDTAGQLRVAADSKTAELDELIQKPFPEFGISVARLDNEFQIKALDRPVEIQLPDFNRSSLYLEADNQISARFDLARRILDVRADAKNSGSVYFSLLDGGVAELKSNSSVRLDAFADSTYYVAGRASQNLSASWTAEGQSFQLSPHLLPMAGGPLVASREGAGLKRKTPEIAARISGALNANLSIACGSDEFSLSSGQRHLSIQPNGTRVEFYYNPDYQALVCTVQKGYVQFQVRAIDCFEAVGLSDQSIELQWDVASRTVNLKNNSTTPVLASLPHHGLAQVGPRATFQLACISSFTYGTAATGGRVTLLNTETGETTDLEQSNRLFVGGRASASQQPPPPSNLESVTLSWDRGTPVEIRAEGKSIVVPPGTEKIVDIDPTTRIALTYDERGQLQVVALQGNFDIHMSALSGMAVRLVQGDSAAMMLDMQKGVFAIQTNQQNQQAVQLVTPQGWSPQLAPAENLRLTLGKDGSMVATSSDRLVAFEPAGSLPTPTPAAAPPTVISKQEDVVRIIQPPLSPAGPQ